jgi:hypothetical protein
MAWSPGVFVYLLAACRTRPHDTWQLRSCHELDGGCWSPGATWRPQSYPGPGDGSQSQGGTWRPQSCPEPGGRSRSREDTWQPQSCPQLGGGSCCLDLMLIRGVPGPQGTDIRFTKDEAKRVLQKIEQSFCRSGFFHVKHTPFALEGSELPRRPAPMSPSREPSPHRFGLPTDSPHRHHWKTEEEDPHLHPG